MSANGGFLVVVGCRATPELHFLAAERMHTSHPLTLFMLVGLEKVNLNSCQEQYELRVDRKGSGQHV